MATSGNRRSFLRAAAGAALAGQLTAAGEKPNIIFVLADDMGIGDPKCYNPLSAIPTPNIDKLAAEGMRFTDMHSPSAVCSPTRYGLMTGRYSWRGTLKKGVLTGYSPSLIEQGRLTLPAMLASQGYYTAGFGKWHLGLGTEEKTDYSKPLQPSPNDHGFAYFFGIPASLDMDPYLYFENHKVVDEPTAHTPGSKGPRGVFWREGGIAPSFDLKQVVPELTSRAVRLVKERAANPEPFFLYLALPGPHTPWLPTDAFRGKSKAGNYGDYAVEIDDALGKVMRAVDEAGIAGKTLFIFTSDNGADWKPEDEAQFAHRANADWRGEKADIWEAGHRVPFIARWSRKIRAGSINKNLSCLVDFFATAAAVVGFKLPENAAEDSFDLLPTLTGVVKGPRESVVLHSNGGMFAFRAGKWKLEEGLGSGGFTEPRTVAAAPGGPSGQLYDLDADPREQHNLYQLRPEVVDRLSTSLELARTKGRTRPSLQVF